MREKTVTLGGREFVIREKPIRFTQKWREKANIFLEQFSDMNTTQNEADYFSNLQSFLATSLDDVLELVFDYSDELKKEREWIYDNVYEIEIITAFREVFRFAYPVDFLALSLFQAMTGSTDNQT